MLPVTHILDRIALVGSDRSRNPQRNDDEVGQEHEHVGVLDLEFHVEEREENADKTVERSEQKDDSCHNCDDYEQLVVDRGEAVEHGDHGEVWMELTDTLWRRQTHNHREQAEGLCILLHWNRSFQRWCRRRDMLRSLWTWKLNRDNWSQHRDNKLFLCP